MWEGQCLIDGCSNTCVIKGEWDCVPSSTPFFLRASERLPEGWFYQPDTWIGIHPNSVQIPKGLFCPEHAPIWNQYDVELTAWCKEMRNTRKSWWETMKTYWKGNIKPPTSPFEE